jgi:hypothetical protein
MSIIVEFTLRSPRLVLTDTMRRAPDVAISVESVDGVPPEDVVTEQLLADVFGVEATVEYEPELQVLPRRALPDDRN